MASLVRLWDPLVNPFRSSMLLSIENAISISTFHYNMLVSNDADPDIMVMKLFYEPFHKALITGTAKGTSDKIEQVASTENYKMTTANLKTNLDSWDSKIQAVYAKGTLQYNSLMIGGRDSFYNGTYAEKLNRVNALIVAIGGDAALVALKALVQTYYDAVSGARLIQGGKKGNVSTDSKTVAVLIESCANAMWKDYAGLLLKYYLTPLMISPYFDLLNIRTHLAKGHYQGVVPAGTKEKVCIHIFKAGETVTITNNKPIPLRFSTAITAKADCPAGITIAGGDTKTFDPVLLGDLKLKFVMVINDDLLLSGDYTFDIIEAP